VPQTAKNESALLNVIFLNKISYLQSAKIWNFSKQSVSFIYRYLDSANGLRIEYLDGDLYIDTVYLILRPLKGA
jgi:hypothetical protein